MPFSFLANLFTGFTNNVMNMDMMQATNFMNYNLQRETNEMNKQLAREANLTNVGITGMVNRSQEAISRETNLANRGMVDSINAQQKELQHEAWRREDNAVQRRAADLKAAGINPILAAGQGAQASAPITLNTPQDKHVPNYQAAQVHAATMHAARMEAMRIETDIAERALRMRDDFATNAAARRVLESEAHLNDARSNEIAWGTHETISTLDYKIDLLGRQVAETGARTALLEINHETAKLEQQGIVNRNHGIVLDNIRKEVDNQFASQHHHVEITREEIDIISKQIANEMAQHYNDVYIDAGITPGRSLPMTLIEAISTAVRRFRDSRDAAAEQKRLNSMHPRARQDYLRGR